MSWIVTQCKLFGTTVLDKAAVSWSRKKSLIEAGRGGFKNKFFKALKSLLSDGIKKIN